MQTVKASIIIPVRNEAKTIADCLNSILDNDFPKTQYEIIIIDGESDDNTREVLKNIDWRQVEHQILANEKKITPVSMNLGIKKARGLYIIRMDAHTSYATDYIRKCVEYLDRGVADNVGGPMRPVWESLLGQAVGIATSSSFGIGNARFHFPEHRGYVDTVYLGAYKKEVFEKIGLFDEELVRNQDDELNFRLVKNGGKIYLAPDIRSFYHPRSSFTSLWRQYFEYGFWKVRVIQKHGVPASWRHTVPGAFVTSLLFSLAMSPWSSGALFVFTTIISAYTLACLAATGFASWNKEKKLILVLPLVFFVLHFSYGFGFLSGILVFYLQGKKVFSKHAQAVL
ncbi:glycosyltransferase family 2 protein [Fibrobacterota bacterium]